MSDTFSRLLRLLQLIPPAPRMIDTTQLGALLAAEDFDATPRTIQRDLLRLEQMGCGIECVADSKPYRWRYSAKAKPVVLPGLDMPQALALLLVEAHLKRLVPPAAWSALRPHFDAARKVVDGKPARRWLERVRVLPRSQPLQQPHVDVEVLAAVQQAIVEERVLHVRYRSANGADAPREMPLHPLGLVVRESIAYLVGTAFAYEDVRLFALHRMRTATPTDERARRRPAFDLDAFVAAGEVGWRVGDGPVIVELAFFDGAERSVLESPLADDQRVERDGDAVVVTATVADTRVLRAWLLGWGPSVEVRRPAALRADVAAALAGAVARYATSPATTPSPTTPSPTTPSATTPSAPAGPPHG